VNRPHRERATHEFFEGAAQFFGGRSLGHFRQRLDDLVLGAVEIFELVDEQLFQ